MISSARHTTGARAIPFRVAALSACTVALLALLLLTSEWREAQAAKGGATPDTHLSAAPPSGKASSSGKPQVGGKGGVSPLMPKILPFVVITDNFTFVPGQAYSLIYSDTKHGVSDFGVADFNNFGATMSVVRAWVDCGYNPLVDAAHWPEWCPQDANTNNAQGLTTYWLGSESPSDGPYQAPSLAAGEGLDGWWLHGFRGDMSSFCQLLGSLGSTGREEYIIPIADMRVGTGSNSYFHLRALYTFHIQNSYAVCVPPPGESQSWYIEGVFLPK